MNNNAQALPESVKSRWDFTDLIIGGPFGKYVICKNKNPASDIYVNYDKNGEPTPETKHAFDIINHLYFQCLTETYGNKGFENTKRGGIVGAIKNREFAIEYLDQQLRQLIRFRVAVQPAEYGMMYFCLRRISSTIPSLDNMGYSKDLQLLLRRESRKGLVLFAGEMGTGKTSGASATISEWLMENGNSGVTLEDPPEYRLNGTHINPQTQKGGFCIQRATTREAMSDEIIGVMRAASPGIIFLGEIRSHEVAKEVILAASNGHLIVSTIHGKGLTGAVNRLIRLASSYDFPAEEVAKLLSDSLSLLITQNIERIDNQKLLSVTYIDFDKSSTARAHLSKNQIDSLDIDHSISSGLQTNPSKMNLVMETIKEPDLANYHMMKNEQDDKKEYNNSLYE